MNTDSCLRTDREHSFVFPICSQPTDSLLLYIGSDIRIVHHPMVCITWKSVPLAYTTIFFVFLTCTCTCILELHGYPIFDELFHLSEQLCLVFDSLAGTTTGASFCLYRHHAVMTSVTPFYAGFRLACYSGAKYCIHSFCLFLYSKHACTSILNCKESSAIN